MQANLVAPLLAGGIGVVGNADLLANIDATDIPSGAYRYTTGADGTFPVGVLASSGGTITLWRQTATTAVMYLVGSGRNVTWTRALSGGTWGSWISSPVTLTDLGVTSTAAELNTLDGLTRSLTGNGYAFLPGGLLVQWGSGVTSGGGVTVTFPIAFPNSLFSVTVTAVNGANVNMTTNSLSASAMFVQSWGANSNFRYIAIGN